MLVLNCIITKMDCVVVAKDGAVGGADEVSAGVGLKLKLPRFRLR
jgi:hypothetical protein